MISKNVVTFVIGFWNHFSVRYAVGGSFILAIAYDKMWGSSNAQKPWSLKSGEGV